MGCSNSNLSPKKGGSTAYFCAVFEQGGTRLIKQYPISSAGEINEAKKKLFSGYDGLYYKLLTDDNNTMTVKGYSIRSNRLIKIEKTDQMGRLILIKYPQKNIECSQSYHMRSNGTMIVKRNCSNGKKQITLFRHIENSSYEWYEKNESYFYDDDQMLWKLRFENGTSYKYDNGGKLIDTADDIAPSDLCTPFIQYKSIGVW